MVPNSPLSTPIPKDSFKARSEFSWVKWEVLLLALPPEEQQESWPMFRVIVGHYVTQWSKQNPWGLTAEARALPPAVTSSFLFVAGGPGS